jgi:CPA2 family monovalent cation:H+ antiporter-2
MHQLATLTLAVAGAGPSRGIHLLSELAIILCVAAVTTVLFQKIRQPVVLGYLLAGLIVGSHLPVPVYADELITHELSEIGVVLLMYTLGLEFSLRKLVKVGPTAGVAALIQCSLMLLAGYSVGRLLGWTVMESLFCGALIAISSTTIIVKAFAEQGIKGKLAEFVFGILIVEDLIAILLLAILTPVASGANLSAGDLAVTVGRLAAFLIGMLVVGILIVPRLVRFIMSIGRMETTVVASVGICFGCALLAQRFGYSVALGAFMGGALVAESGHGKALEHAIEPVRDLFAAIFFVSVGMLIDPKLVMQNWPAVLLLTLVVVAGKVFGVALGAFLAGRSVRTSVQAGMSLAQIGEFSFIIAGVGLSLGAVGHFLYPVAVAVSAITTLITPWLIRAAGPVASFVDRHLPPPLQTFASVYGSWVQKLRESPAQRSVGAEIRKLVGLLLIDLLAIAALVIGASLGMSRLMILAGRMLGLEAGLVRWLVVAAAAALCAPFLLGAIRVSRALGLRLVAQVFPPPAGETLDRAAATRRALLVTLQLGILLVAGIPLAAVTQPFVRSFPTGLVLLVGVVALIVPFWRSATDLHLHVRAGAQVILESLANQTQPALVTAPTSVQVQVPPQIDVRQLVPGIGETTTFHIDEGGWARGKTLQEINLRGLSGATVIAIDRGSGDVVFPSAEEALRAGDVLVLTGTEEAVTLAQEILRGQDAPPPPEERGPEGVKEGEEAPAT